MQRLSLRLLLLLLPWLAAGASAQTIDTYRVVHRYPHDRTAFTQGLVFADGHLYESTGLNGHSSLRMDDLQTGHVLQELPLKNRYFAEGLTN